MELFGLVKYVEMTLFFCQINFCTNRIQLFDKCYVGYFVLTRFSLSFLGKWQRMVLEELEHTLLGNWFHFRFDARRGREAFPCDGDQGSARPLRAKKGQRQQGNYCLKYYVRILINF